MATMMLLCVTTVLFCFAASVRGKDPIIVVIVDTSILKENSFIERTLVQMKTYQKPDINMANIDFRLIPSENNESLITLDKVCNITTEGIIGLIDITSPGVAPLMKSFASALGIAYISVVDSSYYRYSKDDDSLHYEVQPAAIDLLKVVAEVVVYDKLNNVAIVFDETFDIQNTPRRVLTNVPAQHLYVRMSPNVNETLTQLTMLKNIDIKNVFIISNANNAKNFLGMADKRRSTFDVNWFVLTKDSTLVCGECQAKVRVNEIIAQPVYPAYKYYEDFIKYTIKDRGFDKAEIKVDEALIYDLLLLIKQALSGFSDLQPIVSPNCYNESAPNATDVQQSKRIIKALKGVSTDGVFGRLEMTQGILHYNFTLRVISVDYKDGDDKNKTEVGSWTESSGLQLTVPSLTKTNAKRRYKVVTVSNIPPFVYTVNGANGSKPQYVGYCIELLERIAKNMHFEYEIYESEDGLFGAMSPDGNWNGVIRELIDKKADIAVGPISVMAERENVVDFTVPYYDLVGLTILMKKPKFDYSLVKFLSVLDEDVWGCIIGAFFLFSILICAFDKLSPFSYQNAKSEWNGEGPEPRVFSFKEGIWFCMMSLTPQGGGETPRALSGRLIAATWWLFGFIIIATYTANLAAFLTVSRLETPIESLDDLSKQFKVKYAPMNGSNAQIYFQRMSDIENKFYEIWKNMSLDDNLDVVSRAKLAVWDYPVSDKYTKLWDTMQTTEFPNTKEEAVQRVMGGEFAFIADATTNKYSTLTNCDLWQVGEEFSRKPYALAVQEGSPLRSELSNVILQLINQRELEELKTKWWKRDEKSCPKIEDESDGISIKNIGGVFLVIVIGSGLALITLTMECYWYKYKPKQKKKLYNITSKSNLMMTSASTGSMANGLENGDFQKRFESMFDRENRENKENEFDFEVKKEKEKEKEDTHKNGTFMEMVERL